MIFSVDWEPPLPKPPASLAAENVPVCSNSLKIQNFWTTRSLKLVRMGTSEAVPPPPPRGLAWWTASSLVPPYARIHVSCDSLPGRRVPVLSGGRPCPCDREDNRASRGALRPTVSPRSWRFAGVLKKRELPFDALALHDPPHGERRPRARARPGDHQAVEDLNAFFLAFENPAVDVDRIADLELGRPPPLCWISRPRT